MKINVTKEHIKKGSRSNSFSCPIALALRGVFRDTYYVGIDPAMKLARVRFEYVEEADIFLPIGDQCYRFIKNFDLGFPVKPFTFELAVS